MGTAAAAAITAASISSPFCRGQLMQRVEDRALKQQRLPRSSSVLQLRFITESISFMWFYVPKALMYERAEKGEGLVKRRGGKIGWLQNSLVLLFFLSSVLEHCVLE